jgi:predicted amidohydrolase YtcJ
MLMEKFEKVPIRKTYTCNVAEFGWLDQPQQKLRVPMHYVLKNDKANNLGVAPLQYGKVRIFIDGGQDGSTAFLGEDWGKFTPMDDEMKLYLGVAQDVVVKRTIEKNENKKIGGNVSHQEVILKYEIENFKDKEVTLDVVENLRHVRNEVRGDTGRDVEWELGKETTFEGGIDKEKSTFEQVVFHAKLPAKGADGKAKKITHKLHVTIKNEWQ